VEAPEAEAEAPRVEAEALKILALPHQKKKIVQLVLGNLLLCLS
jgi:hypothetical protein